MRSIHISGEAEEATSGVEQMIVKASFSCAGKNKAQPYTLNPKPLTTFFECRGWWP